EPGATAGGRAPRHPAHVMRRTSPRPPSRRPRQGPTSRQEPGKRAGAWRWPAVALLLTPAALPAQEFRSPASAGDPAASVGEVAPLPEPRHLDPAKPLEAFTVRLWTEDDGLPQNMATSIAQTPDGYLWLG